MFIYTSLLPPSLPPSVVWVFGSAVPGPVVAVTPTLLTRSVLATLREVDERANSTLNQHSVSLLHIYRRTGLIVIASV